jgi:rod shape-determining protein MreC
VLLLSDPSSQVGVLFVRNRMMGILQGRRRAQAIVECFEQLPLKKGDLVVTSGLSSRFPPGVPVGTVVRYDRNQAAPRAEIAFSAPLGRLEYVKIYPEAPDDAALPGPPDP